MTHSQQLNIIGKILTYLVIFILGATLFSKCNSCDKQPISINYDSIISKKEATIDSVVHINDSLKSIKQPLLTKYVTVKQKVLVNVHDTVSVYEYVNICDSVINISEVIIKNDSSIVVGKDVIISTKNDEIKDIKKQLRKQKRKTFLVGLVGLAATSAVIYFSKR